MTIPDFTVNLPVVMGFWGALAGLVAGPLINKLFNKGKSGNANSLFYPEQKQLASTLTGEGGAYGGMAKGLIGDATKGFNTVGGYLNPLVSGDPNALAQWTATTNADEARRTQNIARQAGAGARSGATAAATMGAYQGQRSAALANRINARMQATSALTDLSSRQGSLGLGAGGLSMDAYRGAGGIYAGLTGNETSRYGIDVQKQLGEMPNWEKMGGGLMDVLLNRGKKKPGVTPSNGGIDSTGSYTTLKFPGTDIGGMTG